MLDIPLRGEEGRYRDDEEDAVEKKFFRREEISRAPDGAVEDGRSDHDFTFQSSRLSPPR